MWDREDVSRPGAEPPDGSFRCTKTRCRDGTSTVAFDVPGSCNALETGPFCHTAIRVGPSDSSKIRSLPSVHRMRSRAEPEIPHAQVEARRSRILRRLERSAEPVGAGGLPLPRNRVEHLVREAEDLYWNELAWEELTDEERVSGGHLTELVFPGFLTFVEGLLLDSPREGVFVVPQPHPEIVERILAFLGERYAEATIKLEQGADSERLVWARALTSQLIDLVLYRLYRLSADEQEALESGG